MEHLAFRIEKERRYGCFVSIGGYRDGKKVYGQKAIYAVSVETGEYISRKTRRENGRVIIKKENLSPSDLIVLYHSGDFWAVHFYRIEELIAYAKAKSISKAEAEALQFKKEVCIA